MKWFHKNNAPTPSGESVKPEAEAAKPGAPKPTKNNTAAKKAGARAKRAPAKKHITLKNRIRGWLGKPPIEPSQPKRTRLFTQMLVSFICITVLTSFVAGTLNMTLVRNYVQDSSIDTLLQRAADIADMVVRPGGSLKVINVQQLDEWERLTNAQVILINTDMTLVTRQTLRNRRFTVTVGIDNAQNSASPSPTATSAPQLTTSGESTGAAVDDASTQQILSTIDYELVSTVLAGNNVADVRQFDFMDGTWLFAGVPILSGSRVDGAVLLCQPLSQIDYVTRNISLIMSLAAVISTLMAVMLSLLLTQRIVQPVAAMTRTAQRMANGNYGERVNISTTTEIAQLGETLNMLSGNLSTSIRTLNQEKVKMELILSGIGEGIMAINQIGKMVHCNDAAVKLLELKDEDSQCDVYALTERSPLIGMLIQVLGSGETLNAGWKNGAGQSVAATVSPIRMGDDLVGAVGLVRDVSEAERLEQLRRDYVANISHELRTPLTGIRGMVEPLIDDVYDTEQEKQECYQIIYQETRRLERLITDMLDISRLQDGRIHIDLEEMQLNGILHAAVRRLEKRAGDEGIRLAVESTLDPVILGNEDRIMQVLIILIDNALKFTPKGGSVTVHTRVSEGMLWISVRDTGAGIAKEDLPYIFERFYKADKSRMETKGTGLGLAIARLAVELMGGTIWCESELGHGSSFEFSVKMADSVYEQAPQETAEAAPEAPTTPESIDTTADVAPHTDMPSSELPTPETTVIEVTPTPAAPTADSAHQAVLREGAVAPNPTDEPSESSKIQAQIRQAAASVGVTDEKIEFEKLLEMLLKSKKPSASEPLADSENVPTSAPTASDDDARNSKGRHSAI